jgi:hypothetical protein
VRRHYDALRRSCHAGTPPRHATADALRERASVVFTALPGGLPMLQRCRDILPLPAFVAPPPTPPPRFRRRASITPPFSDALSPPHTPTVCHAQAGMPLSRCCCCYASERLTAIAPPVYHRLPRGFSCRPPDLLTITPLMLAAFRCRHFGCFIFAVADAAAERYFSSFSRFAAFSFLSPRHVYYCRR